MLLYIQVRYFAMPFLSAVTRHIIRCECKQRYGLKLARLLSTAAEETLTATVENTRRYVPRSVFHDLSAFQSFYEEKYLTVQLVSVQKQQLCEHKHKAKAK